jgi:hypothetical protein
VLGGQSRVGQGGGGMKHARIIPFYAPLRGTYYTHIVAHFDGRGKWTASSYCRDYVEAKRQRNAAARRYARVGAV